MRASLCVPGALALAGCLATPGEPQVGSTPDAGAAETPRCEAPTPEAGRARLLTRFEYDRTVRDLLGLDLGLARAFPEENLVEGFRNNAIAHVASPLLVEKMLSAAIELGDRAAADLPATLGCGVEAACRDLLLGRFLDRAYRRPATAEERSALAEFYAGARAAGSFESAVGSTIAVILSAPQFLYRLEPAAPVGVLATPLEPYALASRLSYFFWGTMPDDLLLEAAEAGRLATRADVAREAERMVRDPRARAMLSSFHDQWLGADKLHQLVKDSTTFPEWEVELRAAYRESLDRFLEDAYFEAGTFAALMAAPKVYADARLATALGLGFSAGVYTSVEHAGLLGQPALMALLALPEQTSPIRRGVWVRENLFCQPLEPPPNAAVVPPDPDPNLTTRERFAEHTANPSCRRCHELIDPLGFGFEALDAMGRHRERENGLPIDDRGALVGMRESNMLGSFRGVRELSLRLQSSREVMDCLTTQWFRFAMGRLETTRDLCSLAEVQAGFVSSGGSLPGLLVDLATTDAFWMTAGEGG